MECEYSNIRIFVDILSIVMFFDCTSWLVSDLIENKSRFSHDEAHTHTGSHTLSTLQQNLSSELLLVPLVYEPRSEKTGLRGFRPGLTQSGCAPTQYG